MPLQAAGRAPQGCNPDTPVFTCSLLPALLQGTLPEYFSIYGYARSKMSSEEFREYIGRNLTCRYCAVACLPKKLLPAFDAAPLCSCMLYLSACAEAWQSAACTCLTLCA